MMHHDPQLFSTRRPTAPSQIWIRPFQRRLPIFAGVLASLFTLTILGITGCDQDGNETSTTDHLTPGTMTTDPSSTTSDPSSDTGSGSHTTEESNDTTTTTANTGTSTTGIPDSETDETTSEECPSNPHFSCTEPYDCKNAATSVEHNLSHRVPAVWAPTLCTLFLQIQVDMPLLYGSPHG